MKFSLRTLIVAMLLGGPVCAWGWQRLESRMNSREWRLREANRQLKLLRKQLEAEGKMPRFDSPLAARKAKAHP